MNIPEKNPKNPEFGQKNQIGKDFPAKEEKEVSNFGSKGYVERGQFRQWLKKSDNYKITKLSDNERVKLEKELFEEKKYGLYIDKKESEKKLKELEMKKPWTKSAAERKNVDMKIGIMKKFLGKQ